MGAIMDLVYPEQIRDPARIAAMFRALGCTTVTVRTADATIELSLEDGLAHPVLESCWEAADVRVDLETGDISSVSQHWLYTSYSPAPQPGLLEEFCARIAAALARSSA